MLKKLFLSNTQLSTKGAIALAEYLPETKSLVHLANPSIDIAGVMALTPNDTEAAGLSQDILLHMRIDICLDDLDDYVRIAKEYFKVFDKILSSEKQKSDSFNIESNEVIEVCGF
ncbi:hypothetical protein C2G38_2199032 [Gigaspora rosea]|uniref:Uncharacterized protein n=1 Tax=Gigaspora rosea TaxID=44941 RepID=A0A397UWA6_9GLOM|nr:hypothetical protein C2G38_2199032 [Gigaspora rosea]